MRRLRRGAQGAQARERSLLAIGVGRILAVFLEIFAKKRFRWHELGEPGRAGEMASPCSGVSGSGCGSLCRREYTNLKQGTRGVGAAGAVTMVVALVVAARGDNSVVVVLAGGEQAAAGSASRGGAVVVGASASGAAFVGASAS